MINRKGLLKAGKFSLVIISVLFASYIFIQFAFATIDIDPTGSVTYLNTSVSPDKWVNNGTGEWINFTITLSGVANVSKVLIIVPNLSSDTANFSVDYTTNVPYTNASGTWVVILTTKT